MPLTYLNVEYAQRGAVKALGARWDAEARKWFVPEGRDLAPFGAWLPAEQQSTDMAVAQSRSYAVQVQRRGKSLSLLLTDVADAVNRTFRQGEWTIVDIVQVSVRKHVYLELAERDANGIVLAKANAMIWAGIAEQILPSFEAATGMSIGPGMKLLVRARPLFSVQYGFRLVLDAIDPDFTLGELEARKREIRARLQQQELWGLNKVLDFPWDFRVVLVIAPVEAAGLGDFRAEAQRLEHAGLCHFVYTHSRFQGPGAAEELVEAARSALTSGDSAKHVLFDAIVFIRGGGAVNDLAWLNNYELARFVCELKLPVLTGIGHERDSTILDEVAHTSFDTPSKVIAGIEATIARRAREAQAAFAEVVAAVQRRIGLVRQVTEQASSHIREGASRQLYTARIEGAEAMADVRLLALREVSVASRHSGELMRDVRALANAQLIIANERVPLLLIQTRDQARAHLHTATARTSQMLNVVLDDVRSDLGRATQDATGALTNLMHSAWQQVTGARSGSEALLREISGQGPQKTLARGFAHIRDSSGRTVMSATSLAAGNEFSVTFHDGMIEAKVQDKEKKQ
ncbi:MULTISPECIES: exodeoxyribonuclease VII large subunit [Comamonas]|uniref:exodeoxyribonuclease VII large subunit n=1 Tax=Comamonas TaxID=283 RepID=UPI00211557CC|nr:MULTISPECIES: exodeoxyribonuclease VII large subunit [Comamonas]UUE95024.1 exodeoxyribonuclease VII large subunit [Comamonas thiooxydans]